MKRLAPNMKYQDRENMKQLMEMNNLIQAVGKGRRKYEIKLSFGSRYLLAKTLQEMKASILVEGHLPNYFEKFVDYILANKKSKMFLLSFEEIQFLKKFIELTIDQYSKIKLPWYKWITLIFTWMANVQYKEMLTAFKI